MIDSFDAGVVGATVVVQRGLYVATTVAGGVYTFNTTIPAGTYEVVAKDERPDAGLQARSATATVMAAMTTEANFALQPGVGCPTCADLCSGVSCGADFCLPSTGTCHLPHRRPRHGGNPGPYTVTVQ